MINTISFNTGRWYSKSGQRICAWVDRETPSGIDVVHFMDIDRGVNGYFEFPNVELTEELIMSSYDRNWYKSEKIPEQLLEEARKLGWESDFYKI